jgi:hypothetical protein
MTLNWGESSLVLISPGFPTILGVCPQFEMQGPEARIAPDFLGVSG